MKSYLNSCIKYNYNNSVCGNTSKAPIFRKQKFIRYKFLRREREERTKVSSKNINY